MQYLQYLGIIDRQAQTVGEIEEGGEKSEVEE